MGKLIWMLHAVYSDALLAKFGNYGPGSKSVKLGCRSRSSPERGLRRSSLVFPRSGELRLRNPELDHAHLGPSDQPSHQVPAKPERQLYGRLNLFMARDLRCVIEIALRCGMFQIARGRDDTIP
jgi:hypothetical protein